MTAKREAGGVAPDIGGGPSLLTAVVLVVTTLGDLSSARGALDASGLNFVISATSLPETELADGPPIDPAGEPGTNVARVSPEALPDNSGPDLTPRELEVLHAYANGALTIEVARQLYVSPKTVKNHLAHIYAKMGVATRTQAVSRALKLGLVTID